MKKILKVVKILVILMAGLIIVSLLWFYTANRLFLGFKDQNNISYLKINHIQLQDSISSALFDDSFYNSDVFLLGEIHGYADNQKLDKELFIFLNKTAGVRYYLAEMDSMTAGKLNQFLSGPTRNEQLLKEIVLAVRQRIPQQASNELFNKWRAIYDYNCKLADSLKITVLGVDTNFDDHTSEPSRDAAMMANFKQLVKKQHLQGKKFYGFFGFFHTLQKVTTTGTAPFAQRLLDSGFKTTSLVSYTLDSEMYLPENPQFPTPPEEKINWVNADGPLMLVKGIYDLKEVSTPNTITLFKLNTPGSPYFASRHLISIKSRIFGENILPAENKAVTDYFQYVFLLRNSKALTKPDF